MKQGRDFLWLCGLGFAAFVIYTFNLGNILLRDWDEAIVAGVSREIYRATDNYIWLYPQNIGGLPYWNKPPLIHWLGHGYKLNFDNDEHYCSLPDRNHRSRLP